MKKDFIPGPDSEMDSWEENFSTQIALVASTLGLTATEVSDIQTKITGHRSKYTMAQAAKASAKSAVNDARLARKVVEKDIRNMVNAIKSKNTFTAGIGNQLGIIGPEQTVDWATAKPILKLQKDGHRIKVDWNKGLADGVVVYGRRLPYDEQFTVIGWDNEPPYFDERPNQNPNQPETREYYAFYWVNDNQRGLQSDTVRISL